MTKRSTQTSKQSPRPTPIIHVQNLQRVYKSAGEDVHAVDDVTLDIYSGQLTAIVGRSGAGKTTLLNLISGLDTPDNGRVLIEGKDIHAMSEKERLILRREKIGFVFQNFGLLPLLSARENVGVPLRMMNMKAEKREKRISKVLEWVGLDDRANHRPYELSGGEQQRVAVARALAKNPKIILADEPTGQLDTQTSRQVLGIMHEMAKRLKITLVIVTHDDLMHRADVIHELGDGKLINTRMPKRDRQRT
ncbi:MAG: ABC transporter ATP-binding protein [Chloroflexota bacterium]